jgi:outer membrane immunogenic protein
MKKFLLGSVGLIALGLSAPAFAADLPARTYTKAPPVIAAIYDWSGFYIGANGGWGTSRKSWDFINAAGVAFGEGSHDADGAVAGGQIGYRWQAGSWVFGLEAQGNWADLKGDHTVFGFGDRATAKVDAFGLFTGQVGYAWNNALLYVKGGAAVTSNRYDYDLGAADYVAARNDTRWGGAIGAGLEYGFAPNWSVGIEYDHFFIGKQNVDFYRVPGGALVGTARIGGDVDLVTARLNYRFGGPAVTRY